MALNVRFNVSVKFNIQQGEELKSSISDSNTLLATLKENHARHILRESR
jgi:hypothetical protein